VKIVLQRSMKRSKSRKNASYTKDKKERKQQTFRVMGRKDFINRRRTVLFMHACHPLHELFMERERELFAEQILHHVSILATSRSQEDSGGVTAALWRGAGTVVLIQGVSFSDRSID
jgi:hypothetical protein